MSPSPSINPTEGHVVAGVKLDDRRFAGKMCAAQLLQVTRDPRDTEKQEANTNPDLAALKRIRGEVQRMFQGAKARNVASYAAYLEKTFLGEPGMAPPITLYSARPLRTEEDEHGRAYLQIPFDAQIIAIDGETQLAARFQARQNNPATAQDWVAVLICHGQGFDWARQVFYDLNTLGVQPNAALAISMDSRDALTHVARSVEKRVPFLHGRVNWSRRQLSPSDPKHVLTITALRGACVTLSEGIAGVRYGAKPVAIDPARVPFLERVAVEWFDTLGNAFGTAMEDRSRTLAAAPPVFAALGAMGHILAEISDDTERLQQRTELLERLRDVRWDKGPAWEGIAGKLSPKGMFSVGGSKETAYAVYAALNDPTNEGFARVRGRTDVAA